MSEMRGTDRRNHTTMQSLPILEVSLSFRSDLTGDSDTGSTVGDSGREASDVSSLVTSSKTEVVAVGERLATACDDSTRLRRTRLRKRRCARHVSSPAS